MNHDRLIKATNKVAIYSTVALFYWVFVFMIITVFDLKIFRENMTEIFYMSLLGIFSILGGAIVLNVMSNLSKISTVMSDGQGSSPPFRKPSRFSVITIALSFPIICGVLFAGNALSAQKKKNILVSSAQSLISENRAKLDSLVNYEFSAEYVKKAEKTLGVIRKIDKNFPEVMIIVPDSIDEKKVFLGFGGSIYTGAETDDEQKRKRIDKPKFIYSATRDEREYLGNIFAGKESKYKFSYDDGNYQLYFPALINGKRIVLYFSDFQRYGKLGS